MSYATLPFCNRYDAKLLTDRAENLAIADFETERWNQNSTAFLMFRLLVFPKFSSDAPSNFLKL
jgi:hypothetical protein